MARIRNPARKRARRIAVLLVFLAPAAWFVPIPTAILVACGVIDVLRHRRITVRLIEQYFTGHGILTWLLSPINLLADLLSHARQVSAAWMTCPLRIARKSPPAPAR